LSGEGTELWKGIPMPDLPKGLQCEKPSSTETLVECHFENEVSDRLSIFLKAGDQQFMHMFKTYLLLLYRSI